MDLKDGETFEMQGSAAKPYILKNVGGTYSCGCMAWRNQSKPIDKRTCKHLKKLRGEPAELARIYGDIIGKETTKPYAPEAKEIKTTAPPVLLAETWDGKQDLTGWLISEKKDGIRAYWNGENFISRLGNIYYAPIWFTNLLPKDHILDGELWIGRKQFQRTVSICRRQDRSDLWNEVKFCIFDAPDLRSPFQDRINFLYYLYDSLNTQAKSILFKQRIEIVEQKRCNSNEHLKEELAKIEKIGGEGLMLRQPGSLYVAGRSSTLLKVKNFKDDEATVVGHQKGKGKHKGTVGALVVKLDNGIEFSVGTGLSDEERRKPPKIGDVVKFKYQELSTGGVPRFPSYLGIHEEK